MVREARAEQAPVSARMLIAPREIGEIGEIVPTGRHVLVAVGAISARAARSARFASTTFVRLTTKMLGACAGIFRTAARSSRAGRLAPAPSTSAA